MNEELEKRDLTEGGRVAFWHELEPRYHAALRTLLSLRGQCRDRRSDGVISCDRACPFSLCEVESSGSWTI